MQLLFSFDLTVDKTVMQTLACQLPSAIMQLLFSFDGDTRVHKNLMRPLACQVSYTFDQRLTFAMNDNIFTRVRSGTTFFQFITSDVSVTIFITRRLLGGTWSFSVICNDGWLWVTEWIFSFLNSMLVWCVCGWRWLCLWTAHWWWWWS